ncbi:MAG: SNF2-related protein [Cytophagales bacterium]|nr:SNF2-related protein [Cytophagales bacterium]
MKVSTSHPFQIVYALLDHEYVGFIFEPFVVQLSQTGKLTLQHQTISSKNAAEFAQNLDDKDYKLIQLIDAIQPDAIHHKFGDRKLKTNEFFLKIYDKNKGNDEVQNLIENYLEIYKTQILELLEDKRLFIMGKDGEPTWKEIFIQKQKATVLFHFYRNETNTHYLPTIKHNDQKVEFQYLNAKIICNRPAWLLVNEHLYQFEKEVDGNKLKPFLNKKFIEVPRRVEEEFFKKFGSQLIASFDVYAKGFDIKIDKNVPCAVIVFSELLTVNSTPSLFDDGQVLTDEEPEEGKIVFDLQFEYGDYSFKADNKNPTLVKVEKTETSYIFYKIKRDDVWENERKKMLSDTGFTFTNAKFTLPKGEAFSWISMHYDNLSKNGFVIKQSTKDTKKYFTGASSIKIDIYENIDWFDIKAIVKFGVYEVPFYYLKKLILKKQREFKLPTGEVAVIPEEWFTKYSELFAFTESTEHDHKLKKHHLSLVHDLGEESLAKITMDRKLQKLRDFSSLEEVPLPPSFHGTLRPYQHAGYNWMHFLNKYKFGGCLSDDMGLGKTVQTLAFLLSQSLKTANNTSLLVVPTSLIYNWELESKKFTPSLKLLIHTGQHRDKSEKYFAEYDIVLTSYGVVRQDLEILKKYYFNYIVLDESQAIKNPSSYTCKAVKELSSGHKLILTGTPIENSTQDLWSQISFANPGLLGSHSFFKEEFLTPIEKRNDALKLKKLHSIIKPFVLRRLKTQVAHDLPEKIETIRYCTMYEAQEKLYEEAKSYFRNKILDDTAGAAKHKQIMLLQGLTKLRQIANHPKLAYKEYEDGSGKMEEISYLLDEALENNHKVLIFSQFVKHLAIMEDMLQAKQVPYAYLDGATRNRMHEVNKFQTDENLKVFLISLKAGGTGLNLTAADTVFILDPWWNPAVEHQAIDRAHRIGQDKTVFIYKFITKNSVEEKILKLQERKKKLASDLIISEESFMKSLTSQDIEMILG